MSRGALPVEAFLARSSMAGDLRDFPVEDDTPLAELPDGRVVREADVKPVRWFHRLMDWLEHPGETGTMRCYRRYREGIDHAYKVREPYDPANPNAALTTTSVVTERNAKLARLGFTPEQRHELMRGYLDTQRMAGPIVGARIEMITPHRSEPEDPAATPRQTGTASGSPQSSVVALNGRESGAVSKD